MVGLPVLLFKKEIIMVSITGCMKCDWYDEESKVKNFCPKCGNPLKSKQELKDLAKYEKMKNK